MAGRPRFRFRLELEPAANGFGFLFQLWDMGRPEGERCIFKSGAQGLTLEFIHKRVADYIGSAVAARIPENQAGQDAGGESDK